MNDLISRQAAIDALDKRFDSIPMEQTTEILLLRKDLRELPSAQLEQEEPTVDAVPVKHGHYVGEGDGYANGELVYDVWKCSECGCVFEDEYEKPTYNYCPNCGADMRGEQDE